MHYLNEATLFLLIPLLLIVLGWWSASAKNTRLESPLLVLGAVPAAFSLLVWLQGIFFGSLRFAFLLTPLLLLILCLFFPCGIPLGQRLQSVKTQAAAALRFVRGLRGLDLVLSIYLVAMFGLTFFLTLAPAGGIDYDSLVYHLAAPAQYLRAGRVVELPYDSHSYFPFTMEMLYAAGLHFRGDLLSGAVFAKLFHWMMLPISCGALLAIGKRHLSLRTGLFAAALFAALPVVQAESSTAYIDVGFTAFSLLAFLCFFNWLQTRELWWAGWCGAFCGFCLGTKYLGALIFGFILLWFLGDMAARRKFEIRPSALLVGLTVVLGGVWYWRNWSWTGNPVYPFAYEIFGGKGWSVAMAKAYTADQQKFGFGRSISDLLWSPWRLAMTPLNALQGLQPFWPLPTPVVDPSHSGLFETLGMMVQSVIGPSLLAFGLPVVFMRRKPPILGVALWCFAFLGLFWFLTGQYLRYLLPGFALLCLAAGWGIERLQQRSTPLRWTSLLALVACLLFAPGWTLFNAQYMLPVVTGTESPTDYLTRSVSSYPAMQWIAANTPADAVFAVYGEPRCFYLQRNYFWADDPHNNLIDYAKVHSGADLVNALRGLSATYVLWNTRAAQNAGFGGPPAQINEAIDKGLLQLENETRGYQIYRINVTKGQR